MINPRRFEQMRKFIERSGVCEDVESRLRQGIGGAPRDLRVDVLLAAAALCSEEHTNVRHVTIHRMLTTLSDRDQKKHKIRRGDRQLTLRQVRYLWNAIKDCYEFSKVKKPDLTPAERAERKEALDDFQNKLLKSATMFVGPSDRLAIDATAIDAWARPAPRGPKCPDPDARGGHRTKTYENRTNRVYGYMATMSVRMGEGRYSEEPALIEQAFLLPANEKGIAETIGALRVSNSRGEGVREIVVDRAYSYSLASKWANVLRALQIEQVFDLHPNDHGARLNVKDGYLMIDGWAHCPSTPKRLHRIERPPEFVVTPLKKNATAKQRALHATNTAKLATFQKLIAERMTYRFEKHGKTSAGKDRYKCPSKAGKIQCTGCPLGALLVDRPTKVVPADLENLPKACTQSAVTIGPEVEPKLQQELYWGSPEWIAAYSRRSRVEGTFGTLKEPGTLGKRGWNRQMGLVGTTLALALVVAAHNVKTLRDWTSKTGDTRDALMRMDISDRPWDEHQQRAVEGADTGLPPPLSPAA